MAVDEERVLGPGEGLQLDDHVLDVAVVVGHPVYELEVEGSARFLDVHAHLVDGLGPVAQRLQLPLEEVHGEDLVLVAAFKVFLERGRGTKICC